MALYEIGENAIDQVETTSFSAAKFKERTDLQRRLRDQIELIVPDVLVIAEEFGEWTGSRRRIDLLGIDKQANLVVIELKRTEDGGHMELQALRYAAMISTLTAKRTVDVLGEYLQSRNCKDDPEQMLLEFLEWEGLDEAKFAQDVRIVLVSADFSRELTTAVLWLNEKGLDVRCIRMQPYDYGGRTLVYVQQIVPLPEAEDYLVRVQEKKLQERRARNLGRDYTRYNVTAGDQAHPNLSKRNAILVAVKAVCARGTPPAKVDICLTRKTQSWQIVEGEFKDADEFREQATEQTRQAGKKYDDRRWHTGQGELFVHEGRTYALTNQWSGDEFISSMERIRGKYPEIGLKWEPVFKAGADDG